MVSRGIPVPPTVNTNTITHSLSTSPFMNEVETLNRPPAYVWKNNNIRV